MKALLTSANLSKFLFLSSLYPLYMVNHQIEYLNKIVDRQVGRNAELFAQALAKLETKEERYPYLRILISILEQAHPEWNQAPHKDDQIAHVIHVMSQAELESTEIKEVVRVRDEERGIYYD